MCSSFQRDRHSNIFKYYIKIYSFLRIKRNRIFIFSSAQKKWNFRFFAVAAEMFTGNALKLLFGIFKIPRKISNCEREGNFKGFDRSEAIPKYIRCSIFGAKINAKNSACNQIEWNLREKQTQSERFAYLQSRKSQKLVCRTFKLGLYRSTHWHVSVEFY